MHDSLVSIALCTYNGDRFLTEQLDSLVNQTYKNIEVIAVDDKSTDRTLSILNHYKTRYPFIKVFQNKTNLGFRQNFETALTYTTGNYIALCDQDDVWHPDKIKIQIENIGNDLLIYHDSAFMNEQGEKLNRNLSDVMNLYKGNQCYYFLLENCVPGHSCLFQKSILKDLLPFPANMYHDKWLAFVAAAKGNINFCKEPLVNYRQHVTSSTDLLRYKKAKKKDGLLKIKDLNEEIKIYKDFLPQDPFINKFYALLVMRIDQYFSIDLFLFVYRNKNILYYIKKRSAFSKFSYCLKFLWGYRLKMLLA